MSSLTVRTHSGDNVRYIISDTHFGHENIIEYTERPFSSVEEMNAELIRRWNEKVDETDTVFHLGDISYNNGAPPEWWLDKLNGRIVVVRGNHDSDLSQNAPYPWMNSCTVQHGRYDFYCEHKPVGANCWQIHGHTHNNDLVTYPFIHKGTQRVNVSVELIGYEPLAMDRLVHLLDKNTDYTRLPDHHFGEE